MEDITDFISAAVNEKPVAAQKAFSQAMDSRIATAIQSKYDEVAKEVFGVSEIEQEEPDQIVDAEPQELETEMEDDHV